MDMKSSDRNRIYLSVDDYNLRRKFYLLSIALAMVVCIAFFLFYAFMETVRGKLSLDLYLAFASLSLSAVPLVLRLSEGEASGQNPYFQLNNYITRSEIQTRFFYDLIIWLVTAGALFVAVG